ncbi:MAG: hypothetical protein ACJ76F_11315 [Bacteroidia bacterium]
MRRLIVRVVILLGPFLLIAVFFFAADPMRIIYAYPSPVIKGVLMNDRLFQARYLEKHFDEYHSFILGSSRSKSFKTYEWKKYSKADSCFHLGVNDETLYGLTKKLCYLNEKGVRLSHVLLVLDHRLLSMDKNQDAHIFREYPSVSGESRAEFYKRFVIGFFKPAFLRAYLDWQLHHEYKAYMKNYIFKEHFEYIPVTGDINYIEYENEIRKDSARYYERIKGQFYVRDPEASLPALSQQGKLMLQGVSKLFGAQHTDLRIVITPNYDQAKLSRADLFFLEKTFGKEKVFDYSGINEMTKDVGNYYEEKHFKPYIASRIIKEIYGRP